MSSNHSLNPLIFNYIYINEDRISRSLICPICLDPLIDPQTHNLCENSFCHRCITKLNHCPFCRTSLTEPTDLKLANHHLRNLLDELTIQCNICKQILSRADFDLHLTNNCLQCSSSNSVIDDEIFASNCKEFYPEKHLSNLYQRVHRLENEIIELKQVIYLFLFVLITLATIISIGALFSHLAQSVFLVLSTVWFPFILWTCSKLLLDFSPVIILCRIGFLILCLTICPSKTYPSTRILCSLIILVNLVILFGYFLFNYFPLLIILVIIFSTMKYFYLRIPNNFFKQLQDQMNIFFCHSFNQ